MRHALRIFLAALLVFSGYVYAGISAHAQFNVISLEDDEQQQPETNGEDNATNTDQSQAENPDEAPAPPTSDAENGTETEVQHPRETDETRDVQERPRDTTEAPSELDQTDEQTDKERLLDDTNRRSPVKSLLQQFEDQQREIVPDSDETNPTTQPFSKPLTDQRPDHRASQLPDTPAMQELLERYRVLNQTPRYLSLVPDTLEKDQEQQAATPWEQREQKQREDITRSQAGAEYENDLRYSAIGRDESPYERSPYDTPKLTLPLNRGSEEAQPRGMATLRLKKPAVSPIDIRKTYPELRREIQARYEDALPPPPTASSSRQPATAEDKEAVLEDNSKALTYEDRRDRQDALRQQ